MSEPMSERRACSCFWHGNPKHTSASDLTGQLWSCCSSGHDHLDRFTCYHEGQFDFECYSMVPKVVRRLVEQYPDEADRAAAHHQEIVDIQSHDLRHYAYDSSYRHNARIAIKRHRRVVRWLVQRGAKQPEAQRYSDGCPKCEQERGR